MNDPPGAHPVQIMAQLRSARRPDVPGQVQGAPGASLAAFVRLMRQCWSQEPASRPAMSAVAEQLEALCRELAPGGEALPAASDDQSAGACPICLESRAERASVGVPQTILLPCGHKGTCLDCLACAQALAEPRRARCPVCRAEVGVGRPQALKKPLHLKKYMLLTSCCTSCACRWRAMWTSPRSARCEGLPQACWQAGTRAARWWWCGEKRRPALPGSSPRPAGLEPSMCGLMGGPAVHVNCSKTVRLGFLIHEIAP